MSIKVCCHINNFDFVHEDINIFLSNGHIWNYRNLNSTHSDILFKISGFSILIDCYKVIEVKAEIVKVPKFAFSGVGLLTGAVER